MTKNKQIVSLFLVLSIVSLIACVPQAAHTPAPQAPAPAPAAAPAPVLVTPQSPAKAAWEMEWEQTLAAAKKGGRITVHTAAGASTRSGLTKGFKEAYGLDVEVISARSFEFVPKIVAERRAGLYIWDAVIGGAVACVTNYKPNGLLDPLEPDLMLPELTQPELIKLTWHGGELPWVDRDRSMLMGLRSPGTPIIINTNLVKEGEIKSYRDLLNPKWKGKMIMNDPTVGGFPGSSFMPMIVLGGMAGGESFLRELVKNEPLVLRDQRLEVDWLAHGKVAIVIAPEPEISLEFQKAGAPIAPVIPEEGTILDGFTTGIGVINRRPSPNVARIFTNWYLSKEGLAIISRTYGGQAARVDVPTDFLHPSRTRQPGTKYYIKEVEERLLKQPEVVKLANEIFGPLIKK